MRLEVCCRTVSTRDMGTGGELAVVRRCSRAPYCPPPEKATPRHAETRPSNLSQLRTIQHQVQEDRAQVVVNMQPTRRTANLMSVADFSLPRERETWVKDQQPRRVSFLGRATEECGAEVSYLCTRFVMDADEGAREGGDPRPPESWSEQP